MRKYGGLTLGQVRAMFPKETDPMSVREYYSANVLFDACQLLIDTLDIRAEDIRPFINGLKQLQAGAIVNSEFTMVRTKDFMELIAVPKKVFSGTLPDIP